MDSESYNVITAGGEDVLRSPEQTEVSGADYRVDSIYDNRLVGTFQCLREAKERSFCKNQARHRAFVV